MVVIAGSLLTAIILAVLAWRIDVEPRACRETDPITSWFEPSMRGATVDPEACARAQEAADRRGQLRIAAAVFGGLGVVGLFALRRREPPIGTPIDRGFQS